MSGKEDFKPHEVVMPCGQYRGKKIGNIPSGYLAWVAENWSEKTARDTIICASADQEWQYREKTETHFEELKNG